MGVVIDLEEFRLKKQQGGQLRPMTHEEWIEFVNSSDLNTSWQAAREAHKTEITEVVDRCFELVQEILDYALVKNYGHFRFSHAFQRSVLRIELAGLVKKYGLVLFDEWI